MFLYCPDKGYEQKMKDYFRGDITVLTPFFSHWFTLMFLNLLFQYRLKLHSIQFFFYRERRQKGPEAPTQTGTISSLGSIPTKPSTPFEPIEPSTPTKPDQTAPNILPVINQGFEQE